MERQQLSSGGSYEGIFGYCRAVRTGDTIAVAGTAPAWPDGSIDPDPAAQARRCLEIISEALSQLGSSTTDVVRTRLFITNADDADAVGKAHGEVFGKIRPAMSMVVVAALLNPAWKVEIEADAVRSS
jgi:enamine deaminase RidA (YjgF/YER057c/UK114 family)